jgi:hypothetical protein
MKWLKDSLMRKMKRSIDASKGLVDESGGGMLVDRSLTSKLPQLGK